MNTTTTLQAPPSAEALHRQYKIRAQGLIRYDPDRPFGREKPWTASIELPEEIAQRTRDVFKARHGIELDPPEFGFHMTLFRGGVDFTPALERCWGHLDGERAIVRLTDEAFWKGRFVWLNADCDEYFLLRDTLCGLDSRSDPELRGHATIGTFPAGRELPRFLDYRDLPDWGFRP